MDAKIWIFNEKWDLGSKISDLKREFRTFEQKLAVLNEELRVLKEKAWFWTKMDRFHWKIENI